MTEAMIVMEVKSCLCFAITESLNNGEPVPSKRMFKRALRATGKYVKGIADRFRHAGATVDDDGNIQVALTHYVDGKRITMYIDKSPEIRVRESVPCQAGRWLQSL